MRLHTLSLIVTALASAQNFNAYGFGITFPEVQNNPEAENFLVEKLSDTSAAVRAEAARSLRDFVFRNHDLTKSLVTLAKSDPEMKVRVEAVMSLSRSNQDLAENTLLALAKDSKEKTELRALSLKALYAGTGRSSRLRDQVAAFLATEMKIGNNVEKLDPMIRGAAAFALFADTNDAETQAELIALAKNTDEVKSVRLESIKSLFLGVESARVRDALMSLMMADKDSDIRVTAALALQSATREITVRKALIKVVEETKVEAVKLAAMESLRSRLSESRIKLFHLAYYPKSDDFRDPLE